ncbi:MAG: molybdopterin-dependent oxidoreductase, partial [Pseudomonadota bacterium]
MRQSEPRNASRRNVLKGAGIAVAGVSLLPAGMALAQGTAPAAAKGPKLLEMEGKAKLIVLGDKPLNAETPAEMTDDDVTPIDKFFIRNNGLVPDAPADAKAWKIKIDGEVDKPMEITLGDLMSRFPNVSYKMMLECGGNGRSFFSPEARGNQWTNGGA